MTKSTFDTELERAIHLMDWERKPVNESLSNIEFYKLGADGKIYGIVKEGTKYYIKTTTQGNEKLSESYEYDGGLNNKSKVGFNDYNKATKHLELKLMSLNEAFGKNVSTEVSNPYKSQEIFEGLTKEARKELDRVHQIYENACNIGKCEKDDPESKGYAEGKETLENNEPFSEKAEAKLDKDPSFKGSVEDATDYVEVKDVEKDLTSDKNKAANGESEKDYVEVHDDLDGEGVADQKPTGGVTIKINEEEGQIEADSEDHVEFEPSVEPEGESVGDDLVGIEDSDSEEEKDLDELLKEFDEEFGSIEDDPEEVLEHSIVDDPKNTLVGTPVENDNDALKKDSGEEALKGPNGSLDVQCCDKLDESINAAFNLLTQKIYENLSAEASKKMNEDVTKLDAWGKHPKFQKTPFETPANKEVLAGSAEKDWNDDSAKGEEPYGKKIGDGSPFSEKVAELLADAIIEKYFEKKK